MVSSVSPDWLMTMTRLFGLDEGIGIAKLRGELHIHGLSQKPLKIILADHADMVGRAAGYDEYPVKAADEVLIKALSSSKTIWPSFILGEMVLRTASGCSMISLNMKCG